ncbi:DEAD/DEAH box helicase [Aerococcus tenax]|uniref:helicase-related protein n=1 Tax=Aerococcus tenax TaxID=3078812 RepID=UPI00215C2335|nr:DEAD/DEAH box helicase [Aerococcus urinae]
MSQEAYKTFKSASSEKVLYKFQKQALGESKPNYFYALDTGTGKTITSLHHYMKYSKGEPLLIFAPPAKKKEGGWDRDIAFIEESYGVTITYKVVSYGVLAKTPIPKQPYFVIFDEAHYIKNPTSKRGKQGAKIVKAATHFCLLTATPMANGWEDSYNYFIMFGFFKNKTQMNREHAVFTQINMGGRIIPKITEWRDEDKLIKMYKSFTTTISKDDALDLPPIHFQKVNFNPSKDYKILEKDRVLDDEIYDTWPKLLHGLRFYANQKDKLSWCETFLEGTEKNVVIFYNYRTEYEELSKIAKKLKKSIFAVNGQKITLPKKNQWSNLKDSVTLIQYQAGSSGIELQYCSEVIFYTPTYSYQDYTQALGRAYRNGQTKKVSVYQFETRETIESAVWQALSAKKDFDTKLYIATKLGGNNEPSTKTIRPTKG